MDVVSTSASLAMEEAVSVPVEKLLSLCEINHTVRIESNVIPGKITARVYPDAWSGTSIEEVVDKVLSVEEKWRNNRG